MARVSLLALRAGLVGNVYRGGHAGVLSVYMCICVYVYMCICMCMCYVSYLRGGHAGASVQGIAVGKVHSCMG
jgi:hypothetical protein